MERETWTAHSKDEARLHLVEAIEFLKSHSAKVKIQTHGSGWLCRAMIQMNKTAAFNYIEEAWDSGQDCIDNYEWIESGTISCVITATVWVGHTAYINVDVTEDVTRIAISQAQVDASNAARDEVWEQYEGEDGKQLPVVSK